MKTTKTEQHKGIPFRQFPELAKLCWNEHRKTIPEEDAFLRYLDEWDLVDKAAMPPEEIQLIHRLNEKFHHRLNVRETPSSAH